MYFFSSNFSFPFHFPLFSLPLGHIVFLDLVKLVLTFKDPKEEGGKQKNIHPCYDNDLLMNIIPCELCRR